MTVAGCRKLRREDISAPESECAVRHALAIWQGMQLALGTYSMHLWREVFQGSEEPVIHR